MEDGKEDEEDDDDVKQGDVINDLQIGEGHLNNVRTEECHNRNKISLT